jgi:lipopolysaccharide transport system ATP-binding protein
MDRTTIVKAEGISKKFCRDLKLSLAYGVKDILNEILARSPKSSLRKKEFWAVKDVSFELKQGESLGLIGGNGAGKSTMLKLINGLMKPDRGKITVRGSVGALIELGAGFNPILTGKENIYTNGSVLGISRKEINERIDDIIDFSGLQDFIDTPVMSYSSGMKVRLGFAVASQFQPDLLLVDEVLAVGDINFRAKCFARLNEMKKKGTASILVSHTMRHIIQYADKCIWLHEGKIMKIGDTLEVCQAYVTYMERQAGLQGDESLKSVLYGGTIHNTDCINDIELSLCVKGKPVTSFSAKDSLSIKFGFTTTKTGPLGITLNFHRKDGTYLSLINNLLDDIKIQPDKKRVSGSIEVNPLNLLPGYYVIVLVVQEGIEFLFRSPVIEFNISGEDKNENIYNLGIIRIDHRWSIDGQQVI